MIYVASPYSHPNHIIRDRRFRQTQEFIVNCLRTQGLAVFSPIVYWHSMAKEELFPTDAAHWLSFNMNMLRRSECIFVLQIPGWETSKGMEVEMKMASALFIPRVDFDKDFVNLTEQAGADHQDGRTNPRGNSGPVLQ